MSKIPYTDSELFHFGPQRTFEGKALSQIAFPIGGIGTGTISLGGRGQLRDWEIFNRPNKGFNLPCSFFAIRAKEKDKEPFVRVLESRTLPPYAKIYSLLSTGLPRMRDARFTGAYPFARIEFIEPESPINVNLTAFNPFIPLNDFDSGLPVAIFNFTIENTSEKEVEVLLAANLLNPIGYDGKSKFEDTHNIFNLDDRRFSLFGSNLNEFIKENNFSGIKMTSLKYPLDDPKFGSMGLLTTSKNVTYCLRWLKGMWWEGPQKFWDELKYKERLSEEPEAKASPEGETDVATLGVILRLSPGQKEKIPVILTWYFPNMLKYWNLLPLAKGEERKIFKTYYATKFKDAWDVAKYVASNLDRLEEETKSFHSALFSSTLPSYVLDAVSSQASTIKTNTCFRLSDGNFYGFEGCLNDREFCPLNCTHVWNYEQTVAFLFPQLERTMREVDFLTNTDEMGNMVFRTILPLGSKRWGAKPAADGQMGCIIRLYREWKLSGDNEFLHRLWPKAKKALEFAWDGWDKDKDGIMEGEQHNTYDVEFYGPNTMMGTLYLGALKAAEEMAKSLGDNASAKTYHQLYEKGVKHLDQQLFNGEYYIQKYDSSQILKYQYGEGCFSDQLLGEWLAQVAGLERILPKEHIDSALLSIFKYNWRNNFFEHYNYHGGPACFNDEKGLLNCSWPRGKRPKPAFPYCDGVWGGVEYQVAAHLIHEGFIREGLTIVKGVRERHDGMRRNPYDEPGDKVRHYSREMASWSVLLALSGYSFNGLKNELGFDPRINPEDFRCFFSTNTCWGKFFQEITKNSYMAKIRILWGSEKIKSLRLKIPECYAGKCKASMVTTTGEKEISVTVKGENLIFPETVGLRQNQELKLTRFME